MKLNFDWKNDGKLHDYCVNCYAEPVEKVTEDRKTYYFCRTCKQRNERTIVIDPAINWWIAKDGEYWHESAGIFARNAQGKFLFFERLIFPFVMTVPAGHVDAGEDPLVAAKREAVEEVGLTVNQPALVMYEDIVGDSCRRGSDAHRWHAYLFVLDDHAEAKVTVKEEGEKPAWLTLDDALKGDLAFPVRYIIERHKDALVNTVA